jgi:3-hydroxybutyryl-CoA dehydrogenase
MGSGIAQVAARAGHEVMLADAQAEAAAKAKVGIEKGLAREVEKGRMAQPDADGALARVRTAPASPEVFAGCALIIEAIVEDLGVKQSVFAALDRGSDDCVLATNTSSLSIAAIASSCARPERVIGVHFFNPATLMPLVEIVPGVATAPAVTEQTRALVDGWGKTTVLAADTPGFIVNRVARPFYGESLRILEEGIADVATIDWAMTNLGRFKMGPFELMDFIGHDINYTVTRTVWEALYFDPRFRPSIVQKRLLDAGRLGKKSGIGFYDYRGGVKPPEPTRDPALGNEILLRVLVMLVNEAADAVHLRIASAKEVDLAMTKGVNYPKGLLAWGDEIGAKAIVAKIDALQSEYGEDRYRVSPLLRRAARDGVPLSG